jgi:hypothetical protein
LAGCILRAKACVDFQSRPDIGGDPDGLAESFDAVWGTDPGSFSEHLGETAAIDVALNRYAIGMDVSLPRSLAPIQDRRVTAVRATSGARDAFGPSRSVDWSRARVAAEVAVQMSADNEHASLADLSHAPTVLVGHKRANDPSVLAFQVHAAASWGCDPGSFSVLTNGSVPPVIGTVPKGLADYAMNDMEVIRPSLIARHLRVPVQWTKRFAVETPNAAPTGLLGPLFALSRAVAPKRTISKTPQRDLRDEMISAVRSSGPAHCVFLGKLIATVREETQAMNTAVPAKAVSKIASRLLTLDCHIGSAMTEAASRRGETAEEWYERACSEAPYESTLGSGSWAKLAAFYVLTGKDPSWVGAGQYLVSIALEKMTNPPSYVARAPGRSEGLMALQVALEEYTAEYRSSWSAWYRGVAVACKMLAHERFDAGLPDDGLAYEVCFRAWMMGSRMVATFRPLLLVPDEAAMLAEVGTEEAAAAVWGMRDQAAAEIRAGAAMAGPYTAFMTSFAGLKTPWVKGYLDGAVRTPTDTPWVELRKMSAPKVAKKLNKAVRGRGSVRRTALEPLMSPAAFGGRIRAAFEAYERDLAAVARELRARWAAGNHSRERNSARRAAAARGAQVAPGVPAAPPAPDRDVPLFGPMPVRADAGSSGYDILMAANLSATAMADIMRVADEMAYEGVGRSLDETFANLSEVLHEFDVDAWEDRMEAGPSEPAGTQQTF